MADQPNHRVEIDGRGVARVTLDRPELHNAFDALLIAGLTETFTKLGTDENVRAVVLAGAGPSFSAGADINWMREQAGYDEARNTEDARKMARLMRTLNYLPKPTVARIHGACIAGGMGLAACCDIVIAAEGTSFALTEVKLGLIPSVISPYVLAAIGQRAARRLFLTAERFDANEARRLGLVHEVVAVDQLDTRIEAILVLLLANATEAVSEAKAMIFEVMHRPMDDALMDETASRIAKRRASAEGKEGLSAFLAKRKPNWQDKG